MLILILALAACCATLAGGALALRLRDRLHLILGFSAGAVLAAAFFDLLPEALRVAGPAADPSNGIALAALGFFAYTILDRLILRMAVCELIRDRETPPPVVINEALELARTFSTEDAVKFINGMLDGIRKKMEQ